MTIDLAALEDEIRRRSRETHEAPTSRIHGCLLGGAVGDALGGAVEFMSTAEIRAKFSPDGIREYAPAYGRTGAITDDTQITLFTAEGLLRAEVRLEGRGICHAPSIVHHAYLRWLATQGVKVKAKVAHGDWPDGWLVQQRELWSRRAPGNTCLSALGAVDDLGELPKNDSKGCGTVMRVAPVGILCAASRSDGKWPAFELGVEVSRLTHGHPSGYYAGGFFAQLIAHLLEGLPLGEAIKAASQPLREHRDAQEVLSAVEGAVRLAADGRPTPERIESLGGGVDGRGGDGHRALLRGRPLPVGEPWRGQRQHGRARRQHPRGDSRWSMPARSAGSAGLSSATSSSRLGATSPTCRTVRSHPWQRAIRGGDARDASC